MLPPRTAGAKQALCAGAASTTGTCVQQACGSSPLQSERAGRGRVGDTESVDVTRICRVMTTIKTVEMLQVRLMMRKLQRSLNAPNSLYPPHRLPSAVVQSLSVLVPSSQAQDCFFASAKPASCAVGDDLSHYFPCSRKQVTDGDRFKQMCNNAIYVCSMHAEMVFIHICQYNSFGLRILRLAKEIDARSRESHKGQFIAAQCDAIRLETDTNMSLFSTGDRVGSSLNIELVLQFVLAQATPALAFFSKFGLSRLNLHLSLYFVQAGRPADQPRSTPAARTAFSIIGLAQAGLDQVEAG